MIKLLWAYEIPGTIPGASLNSFNPHKTDHETELRKLR